MINIEDTLLKEEPKLYNRNYVYLQLLEKRLKKFEYIKKHKIIAYPYSSSNNEYLEEQDYSEIEYSNNHKTRKFLNENDTIILKELLEINLEHINIFSPYLEKNICSDQEIYKSLEKIKLQYLGIKQYFQIGEKLKKYDIKKNYYKYIYCLDTNDTGYIYLEKTYLYVFKVLDPDFDKEYIFYSSFSNRFYKTNDFIKLDYITIDKFELQLQIIEKNMLITGDYYKFNFLDLDNKPINNNKYFSVNIINYPHNHGWIHSFVNLDVYEKNIFIKGIQKKN
ncbi:hypothetical protein Hokovirus_3_298 [Hokovirus HKV1]|uniref:Uncharacterized protein n=1 Tax=Hokovirus HKV1 TaxID=1977638 RepID=A0A1V0SH28_9VIRU|nr:hypothetical protein Hokovirus_3_298 [Hokovirus HKV1]